MGHLDNLQQKYLDLAVQDAYQGTKNVFRKVFETLPAELPPPRNMPPPPEYAQQPPVMMQQPPDQGPMNPYPPYPPQPSYAPQSMYPYQSAYPPPPPPYGGYYMPPPAPPRYKLDEEKMRNMAKWKATVDLKYVETTASFARSVIGSMAATKAMVELVERFERKDPTLKTEELEMAPNMKKAVDQRREIERSKTQILSDEDMRNIYEEHIFQDMWDQNERGELRLDSPSEFRRNYVLLTAAEIINSGKEVIGEKLWGVVGGIKNKFSGKK